MQGVYNFCHFNDSHDAQLNPEPPSPNELPQSHHIYVTRYDCRTQDHQPRITKTFLIQCIL